MRMRRKTEEEMGDDPFRTENDYDIHGYGLIARVVFYAICLGVGYILGRITS